MGTTIYVLCAPHTGEIRYVGKTGNLHKRMREHLQTANNGRCHRDRWIRSLPAPPTVRVLAVVRDEDGSEMEVRTIARFRSLGYRLTNLTDGGEGAAGYRHTAECRERISLAFRDRIFTPEHRAKISAAKLGCTFTVEHRAKIGAKSRSRSAETLAKIGAASRGRKCSATTRAKMSAAKKGRKFTAEHRANLSAALRAACARRVA